MKIRSVYQAVIPNLHKQPGDITEFQIRHEGTVQTVKVVLGGGMELPSAPFENLGDLVSPRVHVRNFQGQYFSYRNQRWHSVPINGNNLSTPKTSPFSYGVPKAGKKPTILIGRKPDIDKLQKRIVLYEKVLKVQDTQISLLKKNQKSLLDEIKRLKSELTKLRPKQARSQPSAEPKSTRP